MNVPLLEAKKAEHEGSWRPGYGGFAKVVNALGLKRGAEVGVAFGGHSENILLNTTVERLYGVDSYRHRDDYNDPMNLPQPEFDRLAEQTRERLSPFGDRFVLIRENSIDGAKRIAEQLDFVYLDADHSYDGVAADLAAWYPRIRESGVLAGHDYGHVDFDGVKRAVDEFFRRFGDTVENVGEGVWWVKKHVNAISFFIPAYNCETTIADAIMSIVTTNLRPIDEIVITDDGSTDSTPQILRDFASRFDCIRIVTHSRNRGGSAARNTACEQAKNALLFCLDSDNVLVPNSIGPLLAELENSGADAAAFAEVRFFNDNEAPGSRLTSHYTPGIHRFSDFLQSTTVPAASGNYLFTKESWVRAGGYPEAAGALDTWGFGLRQLASGSKLVVLPGSFYHHRYGNRSYWMRWSESNSVSLIALSLLIPFLNQIDPRDVRYLFSRHGRTRWHSRLEKRPLRVISARPAEKTAQPVPWTLRAWMCVPDRAKPMIRRIIGRRNGAQTS